MTRQQIKLRLMEILTSPEFGSLQIDVSQLRDDTSLINDIALDSLQLLELIVAMEQAFEFRANTKRLNVDIFDRFERVVDFVQNSMSNAAPEPIGAARAHHSA